MTRASDTRTHPAIKAATRLLLRKAGGGENFRHVTRVGGPSLSRYASTDCEEYIPADVIADLEAETNEPAITAALAAIAGYRLVPAEEAPSGLDPQAAAARHVAGAADCFADLREALSDGRITPRERAAIAGHLAGLRMSLAAIEKAIGGGE